MFAGLAEERVIGYENNTILYFRDPSDVLQRSRKTLHHANMTEQAVHFWQLGPDNDDLHKKMNYYKAPGCVTGYSSAMNIVSGIPRLSFSETVFDVEKPVPNSGRRPRLRPEQMPVAVMQYFFKKLTRPSATVLDPFMGICITTIVCRAAASQVYWF